MMNQIYPVPPCRDGNPKQRNEELTLFKMATICGYPGASKKCLPFHHSSFPASPTLPSLKCYSFCPKRDQMVIRVSSKKKANECKSVVCYREKEQFDLPDISTTNDLKSSRSDNPYVNKNKVCFKLKGINPKTVYCANRSKPNVSIQYRHSLECLRINPHKSSSFLQLSLSDPWNIAVETIAKATYQGAGSNRDREWERAEFREPSPITVAMRKKFEEERSNATSGLKGRKVREGRPLGQVMSPRRMNTMVLEKGKTFPLIDSKPENEKKEG